MSNNRGEGKSAKKKKKRKLFWTTTKTLQNDLALSVRLDALSNIFSLLLG